MDMNIDQLIGKKICLLLMSNIDQGKDDWAVALGEVTIIDGSPHFKADYIPTPFALPDDILDRVKEPTEDIRGIVLDADYYLPLSVGPIPEGHKPDAYIRTGLKWP